VSGPQHTPGPWRLNLSWDAEAVITTDVGEPVLQQVAPDAMRGGVDALDEDLQLMAAAPDLLEALKQLVAAASQLPLLPPFGLPMIPPEVLDAARAAIAHAEGREP